MLTNEAAESLNISQNKLTVVLRSLRIGASRIGNRRQRLDLSEVELHKVKVYLDAEAHLNEAQRKFDFIIRDLRR